jgi:transposase
VYDLDTKRLLWSGEGRAEETLGSLLQTYPQLAETVTAACCDMWDPHIAAVCKHLPIAAIVYDKFQIIRQILQAINQVSREEAQDLRKYHPEIQRKTRNVFCRSEEDLPDKEQGRLKNLQRQNDSLAIRSGYPYAQKAAHSLYSV